jgi:hypothetical protein
MMNMKEACKYLKESRRTRNQEHRLKLLAIHGSDAVIVGFTPREERRSIIDTLRRAKKAGNKGKKASYNSVWRHYDLPRIK